MSYSYRKFPGFFGGYASYVVGYLILFEEFSTANI